MKTLACLLAFACCAFGQEAEAGFDLRGSFTGAAVYSHLLSQPPRQESPLNGGFQAILYPTWKLSSHWSFTGAVQVRSRPYFREDFSDTTGRGVKADILQANLTYARVWKRNAVTVRVGQMTSAFGAFLLRYDPAVNPLTQMPLAYGYYYKPVTNLGLMGAQGDVTLGKTDFRAQFVNSSPANRRSIFDRDQYGSWAGGMGYTILQGFRVGASGYRGPYLHRGYEFYFPGEARPRDLPGFAYGLDVQWGRGPWNVHGELQRFTMTYRQIPTFTQHTGYAEVRRTLTPRWYAATRLEYLRASAFPGSEAYEIAAGFRPSRTQIVKFGYAIQRGQTIRGTLANAAAIQWIADLHLLSVTGK
ncbi:MAG: hypothetical protein WDO18_07880 [Acidobacteriota bacterium]